LNGDISNWLSKTNKDALRTSDDKGSMSPGLSAADRAAICGLVEVVEKLSEDLKVVSYKVDVLYKKTGTTNSSRVTDHPFGVEDLNRGRSNNDEGTAAIENNDDLMEQMKRTERAWLVFWSTQCSW
jgi:hypothetical protein